MKNLFNKLSRNHINTWQLLLPLLVVANLSYFLNNFIGWTITLGFFFFVPGYLLLSLLKHEMKSRWEIASFSLGLSLLLMMLGGLALNTLYNIGVKQPLTTPNIFAMLDIITLALLVFNRKKSFKLRMPTIYISVKHTVMTFFLTLLPFLAAGGAISLNNGGPNTFTMILFGLIPVLFMILIWRKELKPLYPYAVFMMGTAILFTNSLRGWFITGHDIHHEYSVFQNTYNDMLWQIRLATGDPYNSCLSITILPTVIDRITTFSSMYIYKVIYQILFGFGMTSIYLFITKLSDVRKALLGSFVFLSFPTFLDDMPFLDRQETAFIFFGLLMLVTFMQMQKKTKIILSIMLILGVIASHYSSSYVMCSILGLSWIAYQILNKIHPTKVKFEIPVLRLSIIIGALLLTYIWNSLITVSAQNLQSAITQTITDFQYHKSARTNFLSYSLIPTQSNQLVEINKDLKKRDSSASYVPTYNLPITNFGEMISPVINVTNLNYTMHSFVAKVFQLLLLMGIVIFFFNFFIKHNFTKKSEVYYYSMFISSIFMLVVFTLLPRLAIDYSIIRLLQQTLIITALPIILSTELFIFYLNRSKPLLSSLFFIIMYLHSSGFIPQITGGYKPQLSLNNSGQYYDFFYTHESDILGTSWLAKNRDKNLPIFHDITSDLPKVNYYPQAEFLRKEKDTIKTLSTSYVYEGYINVVYGIYRTFNIGNFTEYTDPNISLHRNLIYSNGESNIYDKQGNEKL